MSGNQGGAKVGERIAALVSRSIVSTQTQMLRVKHKLAMGIFHAISDTISDEVHQTLDPIFKDMHAKYEVDGQMGPLLDFMANGKGQMHALAGSALSSSGLLWAISAIMNNELAPVVYTAISGNPHGIPDAGTIAQLAAQAWIDDSSYLENMAKSGLNDAWATMMKHTAQQYPDYSVAMELVRRGKLGRDTAHEWLVHSGIPGDAADTLLNLIGNELSPADAALAVLRGNMSQGQGTEIAAANGLTAEQFQTLIDNTGEPLGLMELLEARRRGFIDDARLTRGIIQSRIRNEWVDVAKAIAFSPMSTADAVNAVVQNHLSQAQASTIATQNGLEPGAFDILVQTAGEPLSRTEMEQLFNRGMVTKDQVKQALNESRLKPKYTDLAFELHTKLLPVRNIAEAVEFGVLSFQDGVNEVMKNGHSETDAATLVKAASARKLQTYRHGVVTAAEQLYVDNAMSLADGMQVAKDAGFNDAEATAIFKGAEYKRQARMLNAAVSAVRSKFIMHHLDKPTASSLLDGIGIISTHRDELLSVWEIEQSANVTTLTEAQIIKAFKKGTLTEAEATTRLQDKGYADADIAILIADA